MTPAITLPALSEQNLSSYIDAVYRIESLDESEERALVEKAHTDGDQQAALRLIYHHLKFVVSVARRYPIFSKRPADTIQVGTIGLMRAIRNIDPKLGVRVCTYAAHYIKSEIMSLDVDSHGPLKMYTAKPMRKLHFNQSYVNKIKGSKKTLSQEDINTICDHFQVNESDVRLFESTLHSKFPVLCNTVDQIQNDNDYEMYDESDYTPVDDSSNPEEVLIRAEEESREGNLHQMINSLSERDRNIIMARFINDDKTTLKDLAERYGISAERVRQIESSAVRKLQQMAAELVH